MRRVALRHPSTPRVFPHAALFQVIWQLQNAPTHPILPPINNLLDVDPDEARPMDGNAAPPPGLDQVPKRRFCTHTSFTTFNTACYC